ncbi:hypothetical protein ACFQS2_04390 [Brachybacterium sp. GCM10030267]|uniref:hypothetical protein n=1 Tax=unclassified Brachybacterium TaxID=2623841 RepID=UPI0036098CE3
MPRPGDPALASRPDRFELATHPQSRFFLLNALLSAVIMLALVIWGLVEGMWPLVIGAGVLLVGSPATMLWLAGRNRVWRLRDGRPLETLMLDLREDPGEAWRRLSTGDPAVYTPLEVRDATEHTQQTLEAYWPEDEPVTYVVIVDGRNDRATEIIELRDDRHEAFHAAKDKGLATQYS